MKDLQIKKINQLKEKLDSLVQSLDLAKNNQQIKKLQQQSSKPDFWQDRETAQEVMQQLSDLKEEGEEIAQLKTKVQDVGELASLATSEKEEQEIEKEITLVERQLDQFDQKLYLSGPYDKNDAILSIHAGQGGTEACDWAQMLQRMYLRFCEKKGWRTQIAEERPGEEAGVKSVTILAKGLYAYGMLKTEKGTHRLVRLSPFNADNLRQTSFALVQVLPLLPKTKQLKINPDDLEVKFSRSSGHGGQNVNKVSTAVRLKHLPTNLVVECQSERSQEQNRKIAMSILAAKLWEKQEEQREQKLASLRSGNVTASWGTQIRSYVLHPYKLVKDLRTNYEDNDPEAVLDGELDEFISRALQLKRT